jgi:hypothetical protein
LEKKEEYDFSYNEFRKFMDSDRAKNELGHAQEQIMDCYIQSYFLPKEHQQPLDYFTSCQAEHENRSLKAPGGTKPQQNNHRYAVAINGEQGRTQISS